MKHIFQLSGKYAKFNNGNHSIVQLYAYIQDLHRLLGKLDFVLDMEEGGKVKDRSGGHNL